MAPDGPIRQIRSDWAAPEMLGRALSAETRPNFMHMNVVPKMALSSTGYDTFENANRANTRSKLRLRRGGVT